MNADKRGLGIVFHSSSYDRIYHGLSLAMAGSALGRDVRLFFSYWALEYLKKGKTPFRLDKEAEEHRTLIEKNIKDGHIQKISELIKETKAMGGKFYACTNSMSILNIARNELIDEVDKSMGITTFLAETKDFQILFI